MEGAIRSILQNALGEYVSGLDRIDVTRLPLTLKDLKLREKNIQEVMDEDGKFPFDITDGKIGSISVNPGWMGTVEIVATNIVLNMSFSPMKAMRRAMGPAEREESDLEEEEQDQRRPAYPDRGPQRSPQQMPGPRHPPPPMPQVVPPRYCQTHSTSEQRVKVEPRTVECSCCRLQLQTSYSQFTLCPGCSEKEQCCLVCGNPAPKAGSYIPGTTAKALPPQLPAPQAPGSRPGSPSPHHGGPPRGGGRPPPPGPPQQQQQHQQEQYREPRERERNLGSTSGSGAHPWRGNLSAEEGLPPPPPPPPRRPRPQPQHDDRQFAEPATPPHRPNQPGPRGQQPPPQTGGPNGARTPPNKGAWSSAAGGHHGNLSGTAQGRSASPPPSLRDHRREQGQQRSPPSEQPQQRFISASAPRPAGERTPGGGLMDVLKIFDVASWASCLAQPGVSGDGGQTEFLNTSSRHRDVPGVGGAPMSTSNLPRGTLQPEGARRPWHERGGA